MVGTQRSLEDVIVPPENMERRDRQKVIEATTARVYSSKMCEIMKTILRTTMEHERARFVWSRSDAFASAKNNGKQGTDGCRFFAHPLFNRQRLGDRGLEGERPDRAELCFRFP